MNALRKWDNHKDAIPSPTLVNGMKRNNARAAGLHVDDLTPKVRMPSGLDMKKLIQDQSMQMMQRMPMRIDRLDFLHALRVVQAEPKKVWRPSIDELCFDQLPYPLEPEIDAGKLNQLLAQVREFVKTSIEDEERGSNASRLGLEAIGADSCFAHLVAKWDKLPNVVIKVAGSSDAFHDFAEAVYDGTLKGKHFPVFHHVSEEADYGIYVMEELVPLGDTCENYKYLQDTLYSPQDTKKDRYMNPTYSSIYKQCLALHEWNKMDRVVHKEGSYEVCILPCGIDVKALPNYSIRRAPRHCWDIHRHNIMRRKGTGELVILDPVA